MKRSWKTHLLVAETVLIVVCIVGGVLAKPVLAQIRAAYVRDVDNPARQAVTVRTFTATSIFQPVYTVPAGKKFTLEHMNCSSLGTNLYVGIFDGSLSHANIVYSVPVVSDATISAGVLIADGATRIYFDSGAVLNLRIFTTAQTTCTLSGYVLDATP